MYLLMRLSLQLESLKYLKLRPYANILPIKEVMNYGVYIQLLDSRDILV